MSGTIPTSVPLFFFLASYFKFQNKEKEMEWKNSNEREGKRKLSPLERSER